MTATEYEKGRRHHRQAMDKQSLLTIIGVRIGERGAFGLIRKLGVCLLFLLAAYVASFFFVVKRR